MARSMRGNGCEGLVCELQTEGGDAVTTVTIPPFAEHPKVLLWGMRVFALHVVSTLDAWRATYREAFSYTVP